MRLATIDIGTNTAQLLVAEVRGKDVNRLHVAERFVRLGEGVDASGRIGEAAQHRLLEALEAHTADARQHGAQAIVVGATSAMRDAANREAVCERIALATGLAVETLSGAEEARWSFAAACAPFAERSGPCLVVDIGGGSLELIAGTLGGAATDPDRAIHQRVSLDIGCVRLTERFITSHPPEAAALQRVTQHIDAALADAPITVPADALLIGTAGTATALALVDAGPQSTWDPLNGDGFVLSASTVRHWAKRLSGLSLQDIRELHPGAMEGRADVFLMGVVLLDRVLRQAALDSCVVSPYELRHGLLLRSLHG
jgi:exopolyphosphatase/guanosine-5'-triphosphate,3'-diphosphate pyrophosphatase